MGGEGDEIDAGILWRNISTAGANIVAALRGGTVNGGVRAEAASNQTARQASLGGTLSVSDRRSQFEKLVAGDTLFVDACGRVDLPGADPAAMWDSLHNKLAKLPDDVVLFPGHDYGPTPTATMKAQKRSNPFLQVPTLDMFLRMHGQ